MPLLRDLAGSYHWQELIDEGKSPCIQEVAKAIGIDPGASVEQTGKGTAQVNPLPRGKNGGIGKMMSPFLRLKWRVAALLSSGGQPLTLEIISLKQIKRSLKKMI